ncbi:MAG: MFS transporter [Promethearchaeota archaeon]
MGLNANKKQFIAEKYRFVELFVFLLVTIQTQIVWISFGAYINLASVYYGVPVGYITFLGASFMIFYIPVNYFATKALDDKGLKKGVGIGVYLTSIGGLIRALAGPNYWICLAGQILAAIGQPFILNCWTKLSTTWFLEQEKTLATGVGSIAQFIGVIIGMIFPVDSLGFPLTLWTYAILGLIFLILFQIFGREKPENPPNEYAIKEIKYSQMEGLKEILFKNRDFQKLFVIIFIGFGVFNALSTEIDLIFNNSKYPGIDAGIVGALIIFGGLIGAAVISSLSDKYRKRKIFLILAYLACTPIVLLLATLRQLQIIYIFCFIFGFMMVSCLPVGLTYAAEITYPRPEETSAGILIVSGQISGILFLLIPIDPYLYYVAVLFIIGLIFSFLIHDTSWHEEKRKSQK